jgi:hypothetical protein
MNSVMIKMAKKTTMNETSNIPTGGITLRNGATTGWTTTPKLRLILDVSDPGSIGNQDKTAQIIRMTR